MTNPLHSVVTSSLLPAVLFTALVSAALAGDTSPEARCATERIGKYAAQQEHPAEPKLAFVYFTPADRDPPPGYRQRLGRLMTDIRAFYSREMDYYGLGKRTIRFDVDADGALVLHDVKGEHPAADYLETKGDAKGEAIRKEAHAVLKAAGVDDDKQTIIYFCDVRTEKDSRVTGVGPYYGGGSFTGVFHTGKCWFTDATILDPDRLSDKTTMLDDEQYGHISVGRYNSIFIGGAAHELGHGLGLPHDKEHGAEAERGTSLMGSGNRTYGEERRGEGRGSVLTLSDALRLASHPMFSGADHDVAVSPECKLEDIRCQAQDGQLEITGRLVATPQPYAVIAYNDPAGNSDYDATTWTSPLDSNDRFRLHIGQFKPGASELRIVICHINGSTTLFRYALRAGRDRTPDPTPIELPFALRDSLAAWSAGRMDEVQSLARKSAESSDSSASVRKWSAVLAEIAVAEPKWATLADVPEDTRQVSLSRVQWANASVGWLQPARNHFPRSVDPSMPFLSLGGEYHADGLYAHAPSRYEFEIGGKWKTFVADTGLQDGADGSATFVVQADGREVFRSKKRQAGSAVHVEADVTGVKTLELIVEAAGPNNRSAWSVWCDPQLRR